MQEKETSSGKARPLEGRRIVVTRPVKQSIRFSELLGNLGSQVILMPTVEVSEPSDSQALDMALLRLADFDWVIFTSANAVEFFAESAKRMGVSVMESLSNTPVCCVGPETARISESYGVDVELVPMVHTGQAIVELFGSRGNISGHTFLIPSGSEARAVVREGLEEMGAIVEAVVAYETNPVSEVSKEILGEVKSGVDLLTFTSPSTVQSFHALVRGEVRSPAAVIGPVTALEARRLGYEVVVHPNEYSVSGLLESIVQYFA